VKEENNAELLALERPKSWSHLIKTLWQVDEAKLLKLQNADGYFYLLFLKHAYKLFAICKKRRLLMLT